MVEWSEDIIAVERAGTLDGLFRERVRRSGGAVAYRNFDRATKEWRDYTWREVAGEVGRWQQALSGEGLRAGDCVALALANSVDWVVFDQAALGLGLVVVPLYLDDRADNMAYILGDTATKLVLIQDANRFDKLQAHLEALTDLRRVIVLNGDRPAADDARVRMAAEWLPPSPAEPQKRNGDPHELATIVYTSGTAGRPKGVMLTHRNILSNAHAALTALDIYQQDLALSLLPLSHTFERTCGYYLKIMAGSTVAHARSISQLAEDMTTLRPTVMIAVPRVFERVYSRLSQQLDKRSRFARWLFELTVAVGWRRFQYQQGRRGWSPLLALWPVLDRRVAAPVRERFGGRLRLVVSGGAALPTEVARVFVGLGVPLLQGYGLTEASPVVSANTLNDNEPASVGRPLRAVQVKLGDESELLVKSDGVMKGYWNNHAATARAIMADGWLRTGDQARIDEHGHIYITGRLKDILVLSNGEKVPPGEMETSIVMDPLFDQAMVIGENRPFLGALIVLNSDKWFSLARQFGLDPFEESNLEDARLNRWVIKRLRGLLHEFPGYAKIRRVVLLLEPWTLENGLLTPTLKVKRAQVLERYHSQVRRLYAELDGIVDS